MPIEEAVLYRELGKRLRERRDALGKKQEDVAKYVGLERTSVTNIEKGVQKPPLHLLYRLCECLDVEVVEILPTLASVKKDERVTVEFAGKRERVLPKTLEVLEKHMQGGESK
ncbi:MAG: helix-turn-helix transcriptional regulator [Meiothermus sp.]|nr:helix-turn-helix transcriptional regulator [Meiothermus sp.]